MTIPPCRWRRPVRANGRYGCTSLMVVQDAVRPETCASRCTFVDHDESVKPPTAVEKVVNLAVATVQHVAAGLPQASPEEQDRRRGICEGCPHFDAANKTCVVCGCGPTKLAWDSASCPVNKW